MRAQSHTPTRRRVVAIAALALLPGCCAAARARGFEEGYIAAAAEAARGWAAGMPDCTDAPAQKNEVQVVGHISDGGSDWTTDAIGCTPGYACCAHTSPMFYSIVGPDLKHTLIEKMIPPAPFAAHRKDCQWGPWERAMERTTVRATGTRGKFGLIVTAMCRLPLPRRP
ncbi:hypothetical protein [Polyangium sp. 6x1]|uniref:hypothetical protein n=1 Tax=Polyangium sp. 6x1 TaxID=3042689 RepID=UPI0024823D04|nr:hypothetical protein [Polyangium sp. 6x1]MDI1452137.1 hypothetical protein [Polyangium sp. 6x1]